MASSNEQAIPTICGFCHTNCGLIAYTRNGVLSRIKADRNHPASRGDICPKGAAAPQVVHSPDRLQHPLRRTGSGFRPVSWDEALDIVADRLLELRAKHGAGALIRCGGAPVTQAAWDGFTQLLAAYGSANATGAGHLCSIPRRIGFNTVYGDVAHPDYEKSRCIVVWGSNPSDSRRWAESTAYGRFTRLLSNARSRGAKLIVIDPRRTDLADAADIWLAIQPGTDGALALAMLNVIITENLFDNEFVSRWTVGFAQLAQHVVPFTPEWAQDITGLAAGDIRRAARTYATTSPAVIRAGNALDMYPNVVQTVRAIGILCAVTGNLEIAGGDVFFPQAAMSRTASIRPAAEYPLFPEIPFPRFADAMLRDEAERPRAMIVHHANPALVNADSTRTRQALEKLEFLVVCDIFKTATAELADIILPDVSDFERYGFRHFTSTEGGFVALRQKVVEPIGDSRPVFEIEYDLAQRMGLEGSFPWSDTEGWLNYKLKATGITLDDLKQQLVIYTTPPITYRKYLKDGFRTPSGKVEIYSQKLQDMGHPPLPEYRMPDKVFTDQPGLVESYPLIGTTRRPGVYTHTRFRNIPALRKKEPEPLVRICAEDAGIRDIRDGDLTLVESTKGRIEVKAKVTDEVSPGVVIIDFGWGNPWDKKANVNILTSDEDRDPISCSTPNRRFHCQVTRIAP